MTDYAAFSIYNKSIFLLQKRLCANNVYQTHSVASRDGREVAMEMEHDANMVC